MIDIQNLRRLCFTGTNECLCVGNLIRCFNQLGGFFETHVIDCLFFSILAVQTGIPDCNGYRSLCWKILLGYLGAKKQDWPNILQKKRQLYKQFISTQHNSTVQSVFFFSKFKVKLNEFAFFFRLIDEMAIPPGEGDCVDHPLSDGPESAWSTFFKDNEFLLQIDKDVRRLCPDISFFQQVILF